MATIQGNGGAVSLPTGFDSKESSWNLDWSCETVDTTGFGDGGFRSREPVITSFTGSVDGTLTYDASSSAPIVDSLVDGSTMAVGDLNDATGTTTFTATTGCTLAADCVVTGCSITRPVDGKADVSYSVESTGPITQTWDETP